MQNVKISFLSVYSLVDFFISVHDFIRVSIAKLKTKEGVIKKKKKNY